MIKKAGMAFCMLLFIIGIAELTYIHINGRNVAFKSACYYSEKYINEMGADTKFELENLKFFPRRKIYDIKLVSEDSEYKIWCQVSLKEIDSNGFGAVSFVTVNKKK